MHLMEKPSCPSSVGVEGLGTVWGKGSSGRRLGVWRAAGAMGPPRGPVSVVPSSGLKKAGAHCQASVQASGFLGARGPRAAVVQEGSAHADGVQPRSARAG